MQDKDKRGRIMANNCFVLHKEVIDVFHEKKYIPTIEKRSFHLVHDRILGSVECGKFRNYCFHENESKNSIELKKDYAENSAKQRI